MKLIVSTGCAFVPRLYIIKRKRVITKPVGIAKPDLYEDYYEVNKRLRQLL